MIVDASISISTWRTITIVNLCFYAAADAQSGHLPYRVPLTEAVNGGGVMSPTNVMQLSSSSSPGVGSPSGGSQRISLCSSADGALAGSPQMLQPSQSQVGQSALQLQGVQTPQYMQQHSVVGTVGVGAGAGTPAVGPGGGGMWPHVPQQHSPSPTQLPHAYVAAGLVRAPPALSAAISSNLAEMHLRQGSTDSGFGVLPFPSVL